MRATAWFHTATFLHMATSAASSAAATAHSFNKILDRYKSASKARSSTEVEEATKKLRRLILVDGIPSDVVRRPPRRASHVVLTAVRKDPTLRPRIWKVLLHVRDVSAEAFLEYVGRGPCEVREKIRNDTFRYGLCYLSIMQSSYSRSGRLQPTEDSRSA